MRRWLMGFAVAVMALAGVALGVERAWADVPAQGGDVLKMADGSLRVGTLRSFDGRFFELEVSGTVQRIPRAEVFAIILGGEGQESRPPATGVLFSDDFQRAEIGPQWQVVDDPSPAGASAWAVKGGTLVQESNVYRTDDEYLYFQGTHIVAGSREWRDYALSARVTPTDDDGLGMIVRYQDAGNFYRFLMVQDGGNGGPLRRIEKFAGGKPRVLAEVKEGFETGRAYEMRFVAQGDRLEMWLDGQRILEATDKSFPAGKVGFHTYACSMTVANVRVTAGAAGR
ncbi:MAG: hypothetical protein HY321_15835 [Armatimonadetes bacterium]|nr:hypothetical protein [Armatimonadota bacterium]